MRIGIFSDIHANLAALETVLKAIEREGVDKYICLGDVVGYGASPNECCELVREKAELTIMGNHDAAVAGKMDYSYYYDQAKRVLDWTIEVLTPENLEWLRSLPFIQYDSELDICYSHGSPVKPEDFDYIFNLDQANQMVKHYDELKWITFLGHSHLCRIFSISEEENEKGERVEAILPGKVKLRRDKKYIISTGSVGQPRDYDPRAAFAIFDTETNIFEQFRAEYDVELSARRRFEARLPDAFGKRLFVGI